VDWAPFVWTPWANWSATTWGLKWGKAESSPEQYYGPCSYSVSNPVGRGLDYVDLTNWEYLIVVRNWLHNHSDVFTSECAQQSCYAPVFVELGIVPLQ
jgi:hypothetical protein